MSDEAKRRANNKAKVLKLLQRTGKNGATNMQLMNEGGLRFGARIFELRREGYEIATIPGDSGRARYVLKSEPPKQRTLFEGVSNELAAL